uniref:Uncharacterized protein n=1 Tax=Anguilla anguilla TaxID=7936 RepID=A0A0E9XSE2_ANGAN
MNYDSSSEYEKEKAIFVLFIFLSSNVKHFVLHVMYERCYRNKA